MIKKKKLLSLILSLSTFGFSISSCKFKPPETGTVYRTAFESDVPSLDPINVGDTTSHDVAYNIFNGLVSYRAEIKNDGEKLTDIVPDLAEKWDISNEGKTYTFSLRKGVKFHNGRELIAKDIKYSIERLANPKSASKGLWTLGALPIKGTKKYQEKIKSLYKELVDVKGNESEETRIKAEIANTHLDGIQVIDDYTVSITIEYFVPFALNVLAMSYFGIVPKEQIDKWGKEFNTHPIGTGPFMFKEWKRGKILTLVKNPDYFEEGLPYLDKLVYEIIPNETIRLGRFESGQLEHVNNDSIPASRFESLINNDKWNPLGAEKIREIQSINDPNQTLIIKAPSFSTEYLGFNTKTGVFTDKTIRQAFNYAIDKQKIVDRIYTGRRTVARGVLPPGFPGFDEDRQIVYSYDPDKAIELLKKAGWTDTDGDGYVDKNGEKFSITLWHNQKEALVALSASVQADLSEVGIEADTRALQWAPYLQKVRNNEAIFFRFGWSADYPDPDNFLWTLLHSVNSGSDNSTQYSNPKVDKLLTEARQILDWDKREKMYKEAESIIIDDAPWVFLENEVKYKIIQPYVKGQKIHPIEENIMKIIKLEK